MKNILLFMFFLLLGIFFSYWYFKFRLPTNIPIISPIVFSPRQTTTFSIEPPPKEAKTGTITILTGDVQWESRVATQPASITKPQMIQQGEELDTGVKSSVQVDFADAGVVAASSESRLDVLQTLPINYVFGQPKGSVDYEVSGIVPFSVRSSPVLISMKSGHMTISIDTDTGMITVAVKKGEADVAFNDSQNVSQIVQVTQKKEYVFDPSNRTGEIKDYL